MSFFRRLFSRKSSEAAPGERASATIEKLSFGVPVKRAFKNNEIPAMLLNIFMHIAAVGISQIGIFRQPGSAGEVRRMSELLSTGKEVDLHSVSIHALCSVVKKFLLAIPNGLLGKQIEKKFLKVMKIQGVDERKKMVKKLLTSLSKPVRQLLTLMVGLAYLVCKHQNLPFESLAKSISGSIFVNSNNDPHKIKKAVEVMEILLSFFPLSSVFGLSHHNQFAEITKTGSVKDDVYQISASPCGDGIEKPTKPTLPFPEFIKLYHEEAEKLMMRSLERLRKRSEWFLDPTNKFSLVYQQVVIKVTTSSEILPYNPPKPTTTSVSSLLLEKYPPPPYPFTLTSTNSEPVLPSYLQFTFPADFHGPTRTTSAPSCF